MQPDEHKKKRSAQYKKKHGVFAAKGETDKEKKISKHENASFCDKNVKAEDLRLGASSENKDNDENHERTYKKSFKRREITSNWARYDLPPAEDDEASAPKGQDFNKLLQYTGSAVAHFRFKDEEHWEEDGDGDTAVDTQVLSLDCAQLATSLSCLPLYKQLRLDVDIFTGEEVSDMDRTANENRAVVGLPPVDQKIGQTPPHTSSPAATCSSQVTPSTSVLSHVVNTCKDSVNENRTEETNTGLALPTGNSQAVEGLSHADLELDDLLEAEHSSENLQNTTKSPQSSKTLPSSESEPIQKAESNLPAESAELEDWLDSVLDD